MTSPDGFHQIGTVAERVGLSLRTIRHYEEVGLVVPSGRSTGGFRLYSDADIERLMQVKVMKPLGFSLEETAEILRLRSEVESGVVAPDGLRRLDELATRAEEVCSDLRHRLDLALDLTREIRRDVDTATQWVAG